MEEPTLSRGQRARKVILNNLLTILLVTGVVLGIVAGFLLREINGPLDPRAKDYVAFPGNVLIRLLKLSATPLIVACIVVALGSLDLTVSKTLGWQLIVYIIVTKVISSILGLVMVLAVQPGKRGSKKEIEGENTLESKGTILDIFLDMFRNILPMNMMRIYLQQQQTKVVTPVNGSDDVLTWDADIKFIDSMNLLGMIFIATLVGLSFTILANRAVGFLVVVREIYQISMKLAIWTLWAAPVCLFFLIMTEIMQIEDLGEFFATWGIYLLTLNGTFLLQIAVMHPLILFVLGKVNVFHFYRDLAKALITAYVTSSSMASLPVLMECLLANGVDPRVVHFLVPIGVNLNKDGAASFLALATVFIAQMTNETLDVGQYVTILVLSSLGSMAAAAVPFGAVIVLIMILNGLGLEQNLIGGILAVEWINDRGQTLTNIAGNAVHPKLLEKWNRKLLEESQGSQLDVS